MTQRPFLSLGALLALLLALPIPARADFVTTPAATYTGTVNGLRNGKLSLSPKTGSERLFDLSEISAISLDQFPKFLIAEKLRANPLQPIAAAAAYKELIPTLNNPALRLLAEARAIDPTDRNGQWTAAIALFLDIYQSSPTDAVWRLRPAHLPQPSSRLLSESSDQLTAALKTTPTAAARNNLRHLLLDIYTQANDTQAIQRLTREIDGTPDIPAISTAAANQSDVDAFISQARVLESQNKLESAAATWLRIPAHFPDDPSAPTALLHAAKLQQKLNRPAEAQALLNELRTTYPASSEATALKN
jgi:hypothetical protein